MSDKLHGGIKAGSTDVSLTVLLRSTTDNTEVTGTAYGSVTARYLRQGGTVTTITMASLAAIDSAHSDGGWVQADATNMPGLYRFDVPNAAFAAGADWVVISAQVSGCYVFFERFALETKGGAENNALLINGTYGLSALDTDLNSLLTRLSATRAGYLDNLSGGAVALASVCTSGRLSELDAANIPTDIDTLLSRLSATRAGYLDNLSAGAVAQASVCTNTRLAELDAANLPADIDAILLDTGTTLDGKIDTLDTNVDTLITRVPAEVAQKAHLVDGTGDITPPTNIGIWDALGDGTKSISGLNDISTAQVNSECDDALADYDPPTKAEMDSGFAALNDLSAGEIGDAVAEEAYEGSTTLRQAIRLFLSVLTGKSSGGGTTTVVFRDIGDTKDRISATVDANGNRTAVGTRDGS